eukprot:TRINITY_DN62224_c0_g1_i1.p1 TRINITY_DN62224_c0_g1~~TRINITY_DN62224_c0_g1_i1.p1  ORF type:complete len:175 (+),score=26.53 TRINITY_DN62224_c0_g1_i1:60-584(+)
MIMATSTKGCFPAVTGRFTTSNSEGFRPDPMRRPVGSIGVVQTRISSSIQTERRLGQDPGGRTIAQLFKMHEDLRAEEARMKQQISDLLQKTIGLPSRLPPGLSQDSRGRGQSFCGKCGKARIMDHRHRFCRHCGTDFEHLDHSLAEEIIGTWIAPQEVKAQHGVTKATHSLQV